MSITEISKQELLIYANRDLLYYPKSIKITCYVDLINNHKWSKHVFCKKEAQV